MDLVPRPKRKRAGTPSVTPTPPEDPSQAHLMKVYLSFVEATREDDTWSTAPEVSEASFSSNDTNTPVNREEIGTELILRALEHACLEIPDLMSLRATCRALKSRVDDSFPHHIRVERPLRMCADRVNGKGTPFRLRIAFHKSEPTLPPVFVGPVLSETLLKVIKAVTTVDLVGRWDDSWIPLPLVGGGGKDTDMFLIVSRLLLGTLVRVRPDAKANGPYRIPLLLRPSTYVAFIRLAPPPFTANGFETPQFVEIPKSADRVFLSFTYNGETPLRNCRPPFWNLPAGADDVFLLFTELKDMVPVRPIPSAYVAQIIRHIIPHLLRGINYWFVDIASIHPFFFCAPEKLQKKPPHAIAEIVHRRIVNIIAGELRAPWSTLPRLTREMMMGIADRVHVVMRWDSWEDVGGDMDLELPGPFDTPPVRSDSVCSENGSISSSDS